MMIKGGRKSGLLVGVIDLLVKARMVEKDFNSGRLLGTDWTGMHAGKCERTCTTFTLMKYLLSH